MIAVQHITPAGVAVEVQQLTNRNLKFGGSSWRVAHTSCESRGYPMFVCKTKLGGLLYVWPYVKATDYGALQVKGGFFA